MTTKEEKLVWIQNKRKLRQRFVFLSDTDLKCADGQKDQMLNGLQQRLGKTREQLHEIMTAP
jgi:hypothetical protein